MSLKTRQFAAHGTAPVVFSFTAPNATLGAQ